MSDSQQLKPGAYLHHNLYRIERVLGQGGFGITYLATDINLDLRVAIKEFFPKSFCNRDETTSQVSLGLTNSAEMVEKLRAKFLKEARNIAKLGCQGIIKVHAAFEDNNTAYYVMDYIEGDNLMNIVKKMGPLTPDVAIGYIETVAKAVDYIHQRNINHLDIKPANILVRRSDNFPLLIDFGLSKRYDEKGHQTSNNPTGISHGYAPIEQYNTSGVRTFSPQTDIYSLGATLYYLLSGITPPEATALNDEELTFPDTIPIELIKPLSKAMSMKRIDRHATVNEFVADIKAAMTGKPDHESRHEPEPEPEPVETVMPSQDEGKGIFNKFPRKPVVLTALALVAVVVIAVAFSMSGGSDNSGIQVFGADSGAIVDSIEIVDDVALVSAMTYEPEVFGPMNYSGEVAVDSVGNKVPNGNGSFEVTAGDYKGIKYDGQILNGHLEGEGKYVTPIGGVYQGTFKNNDIIKGKCTRTDGQYFEGTFRDSEPYTGTWYTPGGEVIQRLNNGNVA